MCSWARPPCSRHESDKIKSKKVCSLKYIIHEVWRAVWSVAAVIPLLESIACLVPFFNESSNFFLETVACSSERVDMVQAVMNGQRHLLTHTLHAMVHARMLVTTPCIIRIL